MENEAVAPSEATPVAPAAPKRPSDSMGPPSPSMQALLDAQQAAAESSSQETSTPEGEQGTPLASATSEVAEPQLDVSTPEYRKAQSHFDKVLSEKQAEMDAKFAVLEARVSEREGGDVAEKAREIAQPSDPNAPQTVADVLKFDQVVTSDIVLKEDAQMRGVESEMSAIALAVSERAIKAAVSQIAGLQEQALVQQQAQAVESTLIGFANELSPTDKQAYVALIGQFEGFAKSDPAAFVVWAKDKMGIKAPEATTPVTTAETGASNGASPPNLAGKVMAASTRPTSGGAGSAGVISGGNLRDKIAATVVAHRR